MAAAAERDRVAMDLHDGAIQTLSALTLQLGAAERTLGDDHPARPPFREAQREIGEAIGALRRYMESLMAAPTPGTARTGVRAAVATAVDDARRSLHVPVELRVTGDVEGVVGPGAGAQLAFVVREAASNAVHHGGAGMLRVRLSRTRRGLALTVRDDGRGFDPPAARGRGKGLANMAARAEALGGRLQILASPGRGTVVRVALPGRASPWTIGRGLALRTACRCAVRAAR